MWFISSAFRPLRLSLSSLRDSHISTNYCPFEFFQGLSPQYVLHFQVKIFFQFWSLILSLTVLFCLELFYQV